VFERKDRQTTNQDAVSLFDLFGSGVGR